MHSLLLIHISYSFVGNVVYSGSPPYFLMTDLFPMTTRNPHVTYEPLKDIEEASSQVRVAFDSIIIPQC